MNIPFFTTQIKVTSAYGKRTLNGKETTHAGYDLVPVGSRDVLAVTGGKVVRSRIVTDKTNLTWQWGNYVCIQTPTGEYHYYCHLASRAVSEGATVRAGDKLGVMGNTGYSFGAHLHFEVRKPDGKTAISPEGVTGIPNQVGTYTVTAESRLEADLAVLVQKGIMASPEYWKEQAEKVKYLADLLHNMAEKLR